MTPYEVYIDYLALKRHFTTEDYDYHRYGGRVRASVAAFERRRDVWFFNRVAKHRDPHGFLLANSVRRGRPPWIGDLAYSDEAEAEYVAWKKRIESLTYVLRTELRGLDQSCMTVIDGQVPPLVVSYMSGATSLETVSVLASLTDCFGYWDRRVRDAVVWPSLRLKVVKYAPFLTFDRARVRSVVLEWLESIEG